MEVERLSPGMKHQPEPRLPLYLWTPAEGRPDTTDYRRQFTLFRHSEHPVFEVEVYTPLWMSEADDNIETFLVGGSKESPDAATLEVCQDLDAATPWPGPPVSDYQYPDWAVRYQVCMEGRIPESLLSR
jgi:hypothetical protein